MGSTFDFSIGGKRILIQAATTADGIDAVIIDGSVETVYYLIGCITFVALCPAEKLLQIFIDVVGRSIAQQLRYFIDGFGEVGGDELLEELEI